MKYFFAILIICFTTTSFAQKAQNIYFLTNDGKEVSTIDSADFTRVIREPDSGMVNMELYEYYKSKTLKRIGYVSSFEPTIFLEGYVREFFPSGAKKEDSNYVQNVKSGESTIFFENGAIQEKRIYNTPADETFAIMSVENNYSKGNYVIKYLGDSTGHSFLDSNGNGTFKFTSNNGDIISGTYLNGLKNGNWQTISKEDGATTDELFENGNFIKGMRKENTVVVIDYTKQESIPEFKGGPADFGNYIHKNFNYSPMAREAGVEGIVIVSFIVEKDGTITRIRVLNDAGFGTGTEAIRIMSASPKWLPGRQNGKLARFDYILPIHLKLEVE